MPSRRTNEMKPAQEAAPPPLVSTPQPKANKSRVQLGGLLTGAYILGFALYAFFCFDSLLAMAPDEFATFLSGVFAPLAFLWLVLGFFQQGDELRHSADALWLQGEELRNSVEQQRQMVGVSREQLDFERENFAAQIQEARRRAQPNLTFTGGGWVTLGNMAVMDFKLLNRGPPCSNVRLHIQEDDEVRRPYLGTGEDFPFQVNVGPDHPVEDRDFRIQYVDGLGNAGEQTITLEVTYTYGTKVLVIPE